MRSNVAITGAALVVAPLVLFAWKTRVLELPVFPTGPEDLYRVELEIRVRGSGAGGSVRAALPSTGRGQSVEDERVTTDRLLFTVRKDDDQRIGIWSGSFRGVHHLAHGFQVLLRRESPGMPTEDPPPAPEPLLREFTATTASLPVSDPEVGSLLLRFDLRGPEHAVARVRTLFAFVTEEIELAREATDDVIIALATREADELGKARLLTTLLRAAGVPARVAQGLELRRDTDERRAVWVEAWLGDWVPMSPVRGFLGRPPRDLLALQRGDAPLVQATRVEALSHRYRVIREELRSHEISALMVPASTWLAPFSLYRLPVATQRALRVLLLLPLGALVLAVLRNLVGLPTFGTFLPVLLALALREENLLTGLGVLATVIALGWVGRVFLDRLHLLLVPRLCIILCAVVLVITGIALLGRGVENRSLYGGILLPIVILTMLIERFSVTMAEEGLKEASVRLAWTGGVAAVIYPLLRSRNAEYLFFGYPELVIVIMGLLVWIGGYTGYRLSELVRFRSLADMTGGSAP